MRIGNTEIRMGINWDWDPKGLLHGEITPKVFEDHKILLYCYIVVLSLWCLVEVQMVVRYPSIIFVVSVVVYFALLFNFGMMLYMKGGRYVQRTRIFMCVWLVLRLYVAIMHNPLFSTGFQTSRFKSADTFFWDYDVSWFTVMWCLIYITTLCVQSRDPSSAIKEFRIPNRQ